MQNGQGCDEGTGIDRGACEKGLVEKVGGLTEPRDRGVAKELSKKPGVWGLLQCPFQWGVCQRHAQAGLGWGHCLAIVFGSQLAGHCHRAPASPWPERWLYFSPSTSLRKDIKDQGDVLFALFGV